jgi:ParB family chromosome partitioning protein
VEAGLSVRATEDLVRDGMPAAQGRAPSRKPEKDADTRGLEKDLGDKLGLSVRINPRGAEGGEVRIAYRTLEQLEDICARLSRSAG